MNTGIQIAAGALLLILGSRLLWLFLGIVGFIAARALVAGYLPDLPEEQALAISAAAAGLGVGLVFLARQAAVWVGGFLGGAYVGLGTLGDDRRGDARCSVDSGCRRRSARYPAGAIPAVTSRFQTLTLCSTLVIAVTYLGTTISAIVLPYVKPDLYKSSPIANYNILGIPLITVAGLIFGGFLVFLLYQWLFDPNGLYGISLKNTSSVIYMLSMYVLAALIYFGFKSYRKRGGIDMDKVQSEIPVE